MVSWTFGSTSRGKNYVKSDSIRQDFHFGGSGTSAVEALENV